MKPWHDAYGIRRPPQSSYHGLQCSYAQTKHPEELGRADIGQPGRSYPRFRLPEADLDLVGTGIACVRGLPGQGATTRSGPLEPSPDTFVRTRPRIVSESQDRNFGASTSEASKPIDAVEFLILALVLKPPVVGPVEVKGDAVAVGVNDPDDLGVVKRNVRNVEGITAVDVDIEGLMAGKRSGRRVSCTRIYCMTALLWATVTLVFRPPVALLRKSRMEPSIPPESLSQTDWQHTPPTVQAYLFTLHQRLAQLQEQIDQLQKRLQRTSKASDKPPSSDSPFQRPVSKQDKPPGKRGARMGHPGSGPRLLRPTERRAIYPGPCTCGQGVPGQTAPYHTHQSLPRTRFRGHGVATYRVARHPLGLAPRPLLRLWPAAQSPPTQGAANRL